MRFLVTDISVGAEPAFRVNGFKYYFNDAVFNTDDKDVIDFLSNQAWCAEVKQKTEEQPIEVKVEKQKKTK